MALPISTPLSSRKILCGLLASTAILGGCATYSNKMAGQDSALHNMDLPKATEQAVNRFNKNNGTRDHLISLLELASTTRLYGMYDVSIPQSITCYSKLPPENPYYVEGADPSTLFKLSARQFEDANLAFEHWDDVAATSVTEQTGAALTNQTFTDYRGTFSDRILSQTYLAIDYLQLDDYDNARVAFNRVHHYQDLAIEQNAKELEKANEKSQGALNGATPPEQTDPNAQPTSYDSGKAQADPRFKSQMDTQYAGLKNLAPYGNFTNPFALWMEGVYYLQCGETINDIETAKKNFQYVYGITSDPADAAMIDLAEKAGTGRRPADQTYVVIESGMGPILEEIRIDIPIFVVAPGANLPYVGAAFPKLVLREGGPSSFQVEADGTTSQTHMVCSMDRVFGEEFNRRLPVIVTKTLVSTGLKATLAYITAKNLKNGNALHDLAVDLTLTATLASLNNADTRMWHTLPKEIQVARIPTPASGVIHISTPGQATPLEVTLEKGPANVVFVRYITPQAPMIMSQFTLDPKKIGN